MMMDHHVCKKDDRSSKPTIWISTNVKSNFKKKFIIKHYGWEAYPHSNNQEQGLTFSRWEQRASTAVEDHDFPREFDTINPEAHLGNNPKNATMELRAAHRIGDLNIIDLQN